MLTQWRKNINSTWFVLFRKYTCSNVSDKDVNSADFPYVTITACKFHALRVIFQPQHATTVYIKGKTSRSKIIQCTTAEEYLVRQIAVHEKCSKQDKYIGNIYILNWS